jgi:putative tricarboxylic transport membrane protein
VSELFIQVLEGAFAPSVILYTTVGVFLGVTVGAIPGLSGDMAIALLLPLIYRVAPAAALGMLMGIYKGSMFGGSISAISFGVPGTPAAVATVEDGYPAKLKGRPKQAMLTALYSSVTGDLLSTLILVFVAVPMAKAALHFGPVEFFALYVFALMMISLLVVGEMKKGIAAAAIGLFIGTIGMDPMMGSIRLTFGISSFRGGIPLIPLLVGVFAVSELLVQFGKECARLSGEKMAKMEEHARELVGYDPAKDRMNWKIYWSTFKATLLGSGMGTFIGALPGAGSSLAAFMSYGLARKLSKRQEEFGKGSLEGVAAPEAGNSATAGASLIPLFAFGIPGSATAALFGAALVMQGISPGPMMIEENKVIIYTLFVIIIYATFINLFLSHGLIPIYAKLSRIRACYLVPTVFALALLGTYASRNSLFDVWILLAAGVLGIFLRKYDFPLGPLVLGFIVGPGAEKALRQALLMGRGEWSFLLKSPIALSFYGLCILSLVLLHYSALKKKIVEED